MEPPPQGPVAAVTPPLKPPPPPDIEGGHQALPPATVERAYIGTLSAIARILAVRFLLLLAVAGTFTLAVLSITAPTPAAIVLVAVFGVLTIGPLAYLEVRK